MPEAERRLGSRALVRVVAVVAAVTLAVLILVLVINPGAIAERVTDQVLPRVSQTLGRQVSVGAVDVSILPRPAVELHDLTIAGGEGEPDLVRTESARAVLELWPLLRSFGREVRLSTVTLQKPELTLVRRPDGSWSIEDLGGGGGPEVTMGRLTLRHGRLAIVDRTGGRPQQGIVLQNIDATARDVAFEQPLELELRASLGGEATNVTATIAFDRLPAEWEPLAPGEWPRLSGEVLLQGAPVVAFAGMLPPGVNETVTGGRVHLEARLDSLEDRTWTMSGPVRIEGLLLRGEEAEMAFDLAGAMHPADERTLEVRFDALRMRGPGLDLAGSARVAGEPMRASFELQGERLDLDALIAALPERRDTEEVDPNAPQVLVGEALRERVQGLEVNGALRIGEVSRGPLTAQQFEASATLEGGVFTLSEATAQFHGGTLDASGTRIDLLAEPPGWNLRGSFDGVELGSAMQAAAGESPVRGRTDGTLRLDGFGNDWSALRDRLDGVVDVRLEDGTLAAVDLAPKLAAPLSEALKRIGQGAVAVRIGASEEGTPLRDLTARFQVDRGWLVMRQPLRFESDFGTASLGGRIGLDQRLDLAGTVALQPAFVAAATGNRYRPPEPLELPVEIVGTLAAPEVRGLDLGALAREAPGEVRERAEEEARKKVEEAERRARRKLRERMQKSLPR